MRAPNSITVETFAVATDRAQLIVRGAFRTIELRRPDDTRIEPVGATRLDLPRRNQLGKILAPTGDHLAAVEFAGLKESTRYTVGIDGAEQTAFDTMIRPTGRLVAKVATISDLHVGQRGNGRFPRVHVLAETGPVDHHAGHSMACLRAAVTEINEWNPDLVLVKGDIAHTNVAEEYDLAFGALGRLTAPLIATAGNHDGGDYQGTNFAIEAARLGHAAELVHIHDMGSWRVVVADTVVATQRAGTLTRTGAAIVEACQEWRGPCLVALHHQLMRHRVPHYVPTGIPSKEAEPFLRRLLAVNPRVLVTSGHTHRHRVRRHDSVIVTEVGSTKDYPGTWAGYDLYEGGVVQTVRRIADAEALMWNERTRQAALGIWGWWAPGTLADRCFSHTW